MSLAKCLARFIISIQDSFRQLAGIYAASALNTIALDKKGL